MEGEEALSPWTIQSRWWWWWCILTALFFLLGSSTIRWGGSRMRMAAWPNLVYKLRYPGRSTLLPDVRACSHLSNSVRDISWKHTREITKASCSDWQDICPRSSVDIIVGTGDDMEMLPPLMSCQIVCHRVMGKHGRSLHPSTTVVKQISIANQGLDDKMSCKCFPIISGWTRRIIIV